MPNLRNLAAAVGLSKRQAAAAAPAGSRVPVIPSRLAAAAVVTPSRAATHSTIYRAFQVLTTSAAQITYHAERNGTRLPDELVPSIVKRPCLDMSTSEFVETTVTAMVATGDAFWKRNYANGKLIDVTPLHPHEVHVFEHPSTGRKRYSYRGAEYGTDVIQQLSLLKLPGALRGLGPIQAAQAEIAGALDLRDYAANWFREGSTPDGILTSDQILTKEDATQYKEQFTAPGVGGVSDRLKVLGKGTTYEALMLKPADAQWLESRQFTTTELARLFGTPASLMLAAVEGSAMTYSNVEQDWIAFTRFTLMGYLRKIEDALTELLPRGQKVRFNVDALLRSDTKTRYEAHAIGLASRFLTVNEVRGIENLAPLTDTELAELAPAPAPAVPAESEPAA